MRSMPLFNDWVSIHVRIAKKKTSSNLMRLLSICFIFVALAGLGSNLVHGAEWVPDPTMVNPAQHLRLYDIARRFADANFDPAANLVGTHSKHPPNLKQHAVRESALYAYGLLLTGDPTDRARAEAILQKVIANQDTQPASPTYGIFRWNAEDPPKDMNSAAFVGMVLADIIDLDRRHPVLDAGLRKQIEDSAKLALQEVMRRNVDPGYTNIAMLSSAFAAAGQKLWALPGAGDFAQTKLSAVLALADDGEFAEYLSPTYTGVDVYSAYLARKFAFSDAFAQLADTAIHHLWKQVAAAYHAPTFQLGGPYARAYGDNMLEYGAFLKYFLYLALNGNYPLPDTETDHDWDKGGLFTVADLPIAPQPDFKRPHPAWREWTAVSSGKTPVRHLRQYREKNFILGTVEMQDEWKQKRNLVAFWRSDAPAPEGFRVGFCIDESNETSTGVPGQYLHFHCRQVKGAALVVMAAAAKVPTMGDSVLVFDPAATVAQGPAPFVIHDGSFTTYLYPITNAGPSFETPADAHNLRVMRPWTSADAVGGLHVLSYLVVFRPADQAPPKVSDLSLKAEKVGASANATVDGVPLSVSFED
jgi:hypothetical protein